MRPRTLNELLTVEFDDSEVRVRVLERLEPNWNQTFRWADVRRVCFKDAGLYQSDMLFINVAGRDRPVVVLMEAKGAPAFLDELSRRGQFPEQVWRRALGDTTGGTHCWPPEPRD
jgi:hypothetical protein